MAAPYQSADYGRAGLADGSYQFRAMVTDPAGNSSNSNAISVVVDNTAPNAAVEIADAALSDADISSLVTITFSEAVTGFSNADVTVANGTLDTLTSSDGGVTWTATFTANDNFDGIGS